MKLPLLLSILTLIQCYLWGNPNSVRDTICTPSCPSFPPEFYKYYSEDDDPELVLFMTEDPRNFNNTFVCTNVLGGENITTTCTCPYQYDTCGTQEFNITNDSQAHTVNTSSARGQFCYYRFHIASSNIESLHFSISKPKQIYLSRRDSKSLFGNLWIFPKQNLQIFGQG